MAAQETQHSTFVVLSNEAMLKSWMNAILAVRQEEATQQNLRRQKKVFRKGAHKKSGGREEDREIQCRFVQAFGLVEKWWHKCSIALE